MPNTFGHLYRVTTFGESHGGAVGCVIDGVPAGLRIDLSKIQAWLARRKPGQSHLSSPRREKDEVECLSGLEQGMTLGTPLTLMVRNEDAKPAHYNDMETVFRPSHADFTTWTKFGIKATSGGGRASARETIGRVAAAAVAEQILQAVLPGFRAVAWVESVEGQYAEIGDIEAVTREQVEAHPLRCPDEKNRDSLEKRIVDAQKEGDTVGGTIMSALHGVPAGLGDPVFDKLEADLAKAMMSLPASKAFEVGSGFLGTTMRGSAHNDPFETRDGVVRTTTNRSGGIQGGISNGELIYFRIGFKPISTLFKPQKTVNDKGESVTLKPRFGRHDPCVLPRAVPMVEAMAILVLMDHFLRHRAVTLLSLT